MLPSCTCICAWVWEPPHTNTLTLTLIHRMRGHHLPCECVKETMLGKTVDSRMDRAKEKQWASARASGMEKSMCERSSHNQRDFHIFNIIIHRTQCIQTDTHACIRAAVVWLMFSHTVLEKFPLGISNDIQHSKLSAQYHSVLLWSKYNNTKLIRVKFKQNPPKICWRHTQRQASGAIFRIVTDSGAFSQRFNRRHQGYRSSINSVVFVAASYI